MSIRKPMQLRLPNEIKDWVSAQAEANASSQNSEIIRAIRERMDRDPSQCLVSESDVAD
jgi:predicted HicB family RNase H-like nuclease